MSIINDTLDRLGKDSLAAADRTVPTGPSTRTRKTMGAAVKVVTATLLTAFVGSGLLVWHWGDLQAGEYGPRPADAGRDTVPSADAAPVLALNRTASTLPTHAPAQGAAPAVQPGPPQKTVTEPRPAPTAEPRPEAQTDVPPEADPKPRTEAQPAPEPQSKPAPRPVSRPAPSPRPEPEPETQPRSKPRARPQAASAPVPAAARTPHPASAVRSAPRAAVDETVEHARLALARGLYQQALGALSSLAPVPEGRADYWLIKGSAHLGLGELDRAESSFSAAHSLTPGNVQIAIQRAIIQQETGNHAEALRILQTAEARHRDVPELYLNQGYSQQALGAIGEAESSFRIFLRLTEGRSLYAQQRHAIEQWLAQFRTSRP